MSPERRHRLTGCSASPPGPQKTPAARRPRPHLVTLKIRKRRTQRNTEMPRGDMISSSTKMVSVMPPHTTKQSKRLKRETKYAWRPRLYIFTSISQVNSARRTLLAISGKTKGRVSLGPPLLPSPGPCCECPLLRYCLHCRDVALTSMVCLAARFQSCRRHYLEV